MAGSVNKVIIVGNLGKDPEIRTMQSGDKVASFSVATSERWKDKMSGEQKERTEWHRISIFNKALVDVAERYLKKGAKVYIEGQLETRKWTDQSGKENYTTEIVLRPFRGELTMLDGRAGGGSSFQDNGDAPSYESAQPGGFGGGNFGGGGGFGGGAAAPATKIDDMEDEIPF